MASLRLALRLSREASEAPAPAPQVQEDEPPARPKKKKPSKRQPKVAAARPKARSRKPPATAVGGGTLEKLPWELLGAVAKYLTVEDAARWRGCGRSSAAGVGALWGEDPAGALRRRAERADFEDRVHERRGRRGALGAPAQHALPSMWKRRPRRGLRLL